MLARLLAAAAALAALAASAAPGPPFRVEGAPPPRLESGRTVTVEVAVTNTGAASWTEGRPFRLAYHWLRPDGSVAMWDGPRTELPLPLPAGGTVRVRARVVAPPRPGRYLLQWDVVEEHVRWLSELSDEPPPTYPVTVVRAPRRHRFRPVAAAWPWVMAAGGERRLRVRVRNAGDVAWTPDRPIHLAYHWLRRDGSVLERDGLRTELPLPVPPGGEVEVSARVRAPSRAGLLRLQWDVVEEGVCWFSQRMPEPPPSRLVLVVPLRPLGFGALAAVALAAAWRLRRLPDGAVTWWTWAPLGWLAAGLLLGQAWVMAQAGPLPGSPSPLVAASGVALLALVVVALPARARPWAALGLGLLGAAVLEGDAIYLRYFHDLPSLALLRAARQTGQVTGSIAALMERADLWLAVPLLPGAWLAAEAARRRPPRGSRPVLAAALLLALLPGAAWAVRASTSRYGRDVQRFSSLQLARRVGVVGYHLVDAWDRAKEAAWGFALSRADRERVLELFARRRPLREGRGPLFGIARGMNLAVIQVESLQGFVLRLDVGGEPVTPALRRLAREGVELARCTDQTAYGRTSDAELLSEASLLPVAHGAACFRHGGNRFVALAGVLAAHGYATLSAVPFEGRFWNRRVTHPAFGFAASLFADAFRPGRRIGWGLNDRDFLAQMAERLEALPEPFFAYMITLSLHHPFEGFPRDLEELPVGRWEGTPFGGYLHAMRFADRAIAGFLDRLAADGLLDRTVVVIFGDHDAGFPWEADLAEAMGFPHDELHWLLEDRIPVIVRMPGEDAPRGARIEAPTGLWDLPPTLAALLGVDPGPLPWLGRNLAVAAAAGPVPRPGGSWIGPRLLWSGETTRRCWEWRSGRELPAAACAGGSRAAAALAEASELALEGDLQPWLAGQLGGGGER